MSRSQKIDPKGKLRIPANARSEVGDCTEFCVTSEDGKFARVYPLRIWNGVEKRLAGTHPQNSNKQEHLIWAKYLGQAVTMDKQGRALIPVVPRETAHILGEVAVLGYPKYLEVWNHTPFLKSLGHSSITARDDKTMNRMLYN